MRHVSPPAGGDGTVLNTSDRVLATMYRGAGFCRKRCEVGLAACDLRAFDGPQVLLEQAALGLDHEVQALSAAVVDEHGPVRVVRAERGWHGEPAGQLGLARLVRSAASAPTPTSGLVAGAVVIEVGGARVTVTRGADLQVLVMVLALSILRRRNDRRCDWEDDMPHRHL